MPAPLSAAPPSVPDWAATLLQASDVVTALLGLFIAYQAYRGYRRNDSRPMAFVSLGFALALGVPFALLLVATALPGASRVALAALTQASELLGLLAVLYALRMRP